MITIEDLIGGMGVEVDGVEEVSKGEAVEVEGEVEVEIEVIYFYHFLFYN